MVAGRARPAGPYVIISSDFEALTYRLKRLDNGDVHPLAVPESDLRVRTF